jgi:hypothetical protein
MSDLIYYLTIPSRWVPFGNWQNPSQLLIIALIYTSLGTYILINKVSGAKSVTAPVSFAVLFACAVGANRVMERYHLPNTNELQQIMVYSTLGVTFGALLLLLTFRVASRGEG